MMSDENTATNSGGECTPAAMLGILQRQIRELEAVRVQIQAFHNRHPKAKRKPLSADDNPELMHVALELQSLRKIADNIEREIREGNNDRGN
jgi:hypothetical protein